jgi:hypothetical protein
MTLLLVLSLLRCAVFTFNVLKDAKRFIAITGEQTARLLGAVVHATAVQASIPMSV